MEATIHRTQSKAADDNDKEKNQDTWPVFDHKFPELVAHEMCTVTKNTK